MPSGLRFSWRRYACLFTQFYLKQAKMQVKMPNNMDQRSEFKNTLNYFLRPFIYFYKLKGRVVEATISSQSKIYFKDFINYSGGLDFGERWI